MTVHTHRVYCQSSSQEATRQDIDRKKLQVTPTTNNMFTSSSSYVKWLRCLKHYSLIAVTFILVPINLVGSYPSGAQIGNTACSDMMPQHGASARTTASPYSITASSSTYSPGQQITVTLSGGSTRFLGFLVEGRRSSDSSTIGTFTSKSGVALLCSNQAAAHSSATTRTSVTLTWTAPTTTGLGNIYFQATIVEQLSTFWTNVRSSLIVEATTTTVTSTTSTTTTTATTTTTMTSKPTLLSSSASMLSSPQQYSSSSSSKSSLTSSSSLSTVSKPSSSSVTSSSSSPSTVTPSSTDAAVEPTTTIADSSEFPLPTTTTAPGSQAGDSGNGLYTDSKGNKLTWSKANDHAIQFELTASVDSMQSWVAFGLSSVDGMSPASVVECYYDDQSQFIKVRASQNIGFNNYLLSNDQLGLVQGSTSGTYNQGKISCRFQRLISSANSSTTGGRRKRQSSPDLVYPLDSAVYYILIAQGPAYGGVKSQHTTYSISSDLFNFTSFSTVPGTSLRVNLMKAHGVLMVIAWIMFASFGVLMPRYCKLAWPDTTWGGKKVWFQIHQPCMIITLVLTAAGFIIIFCEAKTYVTSLPSPTSAHPPLGIIVMILVLANPIMAIFRCEPNARYRPIFNILHFIVGLLAQATAVVTIFLGLYMTALNLPFWTIAAMSSYICFHVLVEIVLAIHMHTINHRRKTEKPSPYDSNAFPLQPSDSSATLDVIPKTNSDSGSTFKSIVLAVHATSCFVCTVAISIQICIST